MVVFKGHTHITIAILAGAILYRTGINGLPLVFIVIGALIPDIDYPRSMLGQFNVLAWTGLMRHRGFMHTAPALILFTSVISIFNPLYGGCFAIGYLSHLIADSANPAGIMWLYPYRRNFYNLACFPAGGIEEQALFIVLFLLIFM